MNNDSEVLKSNRLLKESRKILFPENTLSRNTQSKTMKDNAHTSLMHEESIPIFMLGTN